MLKYITEKLIGQILPSVLATVIGAYVVNQYIGRPDTPPAAQTAKADDSAKATKAADLPAGAGGQPEAAKTEAAKTEPVKIKLGADKAPVEKAAAEKPAGRHQITTHDKAPAKPVTTATATPEPVKLPDERSEPNRDPNEVLRAAVERLRATAPVEASRTTEVAVRNPEPKLQEPPKVQEAPKVQDLPKPQEPPRIAAPLQALPPAVTIAPATTGSTAPYAAASAAAPSSTDLGASLDSRDSRRPTPPADIPESRADLSGDVGLTPARKPSVAEDVLFAAKSMFHAVLPR